MPVKLNTTTSPARTGTGVAFSRGYCSIGKCQPPSGSDRAYGCWARPEDNLSQVSGAIIADHDDYTCLGTVGYQQTFQRAFQVGILEGISRFEQPLWQHARPLKQQIGGFTQYHAQRERRRTHY